MARANFLIAASLAIAGLGLAVSSGPAAAQAEIQDVHGGTIDLPLNKSRVISVDRPIARAMIGNSEIADILPLTSQSVYVLGKSMGTTSLTLYGEGGRVLSVLDVAVGPDVDAYQQQLARLIPDSNIQASISGSSMVLTGVVSDAGAIDRALRLASTYAGDNVVNMISLGSSQQVMLEVRFAEISRQVRDEIGIRGIGTSQGGSFNGVFGDGAVFSPGNGAIGGDAGAGLITDSFGVFSQLFSIGNIDIEGILTALERRGFARTLAEPTLVALSGEEASFLAGGEYPIPVTQGSSNDSSTITIQFKQFGVSLGFVPTVLADDTINLRVRPEVSSIDPASSVTLNGITVPGLQTRRASTVIELRDGESFAIAGLLQEDYETVVRQLPILGSIPILGSLFRSTEFQKGETELLIVVTPRLVQPIRPDQVYLPTDRVETPEPLDIFLLGEGEDPLPSRRAAPLPEESFEGGDYEY
ncbi:type II and III secretion system protein family protein [Aurantiacibacter odishensis]|uniref:type II and III secretion system protein family protein n=1 Tax=Aurantiacibacter odishensis TaxID=1155476 RepID=UPI000E756B38|nr:type II and III secretion system protein family protein [Aurantiacibacter odishensis]